MFFSMENFSYPRSCPVVEGIPLRYSVGFYRNRVRRVFAWFVDYDSAFAYLERISRVYPHLKIDLLQSLF
mgnify:CR=1 FL=1